MVGDRRVDFLMMDGKCREMNVLFAVSAGSSSGDVHKIDAIRLMCKKDLSKT